MLKTTGQNIAENIRAKHCQRKQGKTQLKGTRDSLKLFTLKHEVMVSQKAVLKPNELYLPSGGPWSEYSTVFLSFLALCGMGTAQWLERQTCD